jgi:hypothetical protein
MLKNTAGQYVGFHLISATDGSDVTSGSPTVYVTGDGGTQATGSGTSTHEGNGQWSYAPTQAETNYNHVMFSMSISGAVTGFSERDPITLDNFKADVSTLLSELAKVPKSDSDVTWNATALASINAEADTAISDADLATADALATVASYIDTEISTLLTQIGTAGDGLTSIPWNPDWDAEVQSECDDALDAFVCDTDIGLAKLGEILAALAAGKVAASSAAGITTLSYKMRDGATTSFTTVVTEADNTRATTGALS